MSLRTDYKDDIFSGRRKYTEINNGDGTISFNDETEYSQVGDSFGATQINEIDGKINGHDTSISDINTRIGTINSNISNLNNELTYSGTKFYFDYKNGKWGWNSSSARGADTFHPFSQIQKIAIGKILVSGAGSGNGVYVTDVEVDISEVNRLHVNLYWTNSQQYGNRTAYIDGSADGSNWNRIWTNPQTASTIDIGTFDVTNYKYVAFHAETYGMGVSSGFWGISGYNVI